MKIVARRAGAVLCALACGLTQGAENSSGTIEKGSFHLSRDARGITGLANPHHPFNAQMLPHGQRFGLAVKFKRRIWVRGLP